MLSTDHVGRRFKQREAVHDISLNVYAGEFFGLLGPNGAGKSTLLKIWTTLLPPTSGRAFVDGYDVVHQKAEVRRHIGVVFQESILDDQLTAAENLRFHALVYGLPVALRAKRMAEVLQLVGLADRARDRVRTFSGGMRRRLEIARGLLHTPRLLFLEEPTVGLDPTTRAQIWSYTSTFARQRD
ncbi:MAG: ATP-binding cassette domain-containing protein [Firmicutes bacterium]|nr:ATP-binding cassette domain-containing protein [Bacillota bacterium]